MFPYDSITSGVLPPFTPELQRYAERVWERWQLRVIYAEFEIAQVYFYSELYIDLKTEAMRKHRNCWMQYNETIRVFG